MDEYRMIGCDAVSRSTGFNFECSPLSCNTLAADFPVNKYCLADTLPDEIEMALAFSKEQAEPGPYFVIEAWVKGARIPQPSAVSG